MIVRLAPVLAALCATAASAQPHIVTPRSVSPAAQQHVVRPGGRLRARFGLCFVGGGYNCVVDGDTIWLQGRKIRIADIDARETHDPRCASEKELGDRATLRLQQLLNRGSIRLRPADRDRDRYGRLLRVVLVGGESVGDVLIGEGLARPYAGHRRPWC
jgi:endonuclease YncB( thermonuclease family)